MLTKLTIRNFKRFEDVEIELDNPVVFIGPNNSGKTSAMQALALWDTGLKRWNEKRLGKAVSGKRRRGAAVNRRDIPARPGIDKTGVRGCFCFSRRPASWRRSTRKQAPRPTKFPQIAALRDILLPKLTSGELRPSDAARQVETVV